MLFSFLIASVSAAAGSPINDCDEHGAMPNQYVVTLQEPRPAMSSGVPSSPQSLETQDMASYIQDWLRPYNPDYTSNGAGRRKLGANADSPLVFHVYTAIEPAVAINASDEVRHAPSSHTRTNMLSSSTSALVFVYLMAAHAHHISDRRAHGEGPGRQVH